MAYNYGLMRKAEMREQDERSLTLTPPTKVPAVPVFEQVDPPRNDKPTPTPLAGVPAARGSRIRRYPDNAYTRRRRRNAR